MMPSPGWTLKAAKIGLRNLWKVQRNGSFFVCPPWLGSTGSPNDAAVTLWSSNLIGH